MRTVWYVVAGTSVTIGVVATVVPLLPTTPFVLLGGYAATRASPRLVRWILRHRTIGPVLRNWHRHRAIPVRAKIVGVASLIVSFVVVLYAFDQRWIQATAAVILLTVAAYLLSRPSSSA